MKNIFKLIIFFSIFTGCKKEFLNDCDEESSTFKPINASFSISKQNQTVNFVNNSENAESFLWEFGDGTTSNNPNPSPKIFPISDKPYTIKLTAKRCNGERVKTVSQLLEVKCPASTPIISANKLKLCAGESTTLTSTACTNGTVLWSTGATSSSITTNVAGTYSAQCKDVSQCIGSKSNLVQITVNPKPAAPIISALVAKVCEGEKATLSATGCTGGIIKWSDGSSGARIEPIINQNELFTAICIQNECESVKSNIVNIAVNPLALVYTEKATISNNKSNWVLNGKIDFKTISNDGNVTDHGFIYANGNVDPQTINFTRVELKEKIESIGTTFLYEIPDSKGKLFSYRVFVKLCNGKTVYGNLLKTQ